MPSYDCVCSANIQERLFEQLSQLISSALSAQGKQRRAVLRQLVCKAGEIQTTLLKHLAKEEEQLFPLLLQHFSHTEQVCGDALTYRRSNESEVQKVLGAAACEC